MSDVIDQIYRGVLSGIVSGRFSPGVRLPSESELALMFGSTRMNAARALRRLREEGILYSRKRAGTFIAPSLSEEEVCRLRCRCSKRITVLYSGTHANVHWSEESFDEFDSLVSARGYQVTYDQIPTASGRESYAGLLKKVKDFLPAALVIYPGADDLFFLLDNNDLLLDMPFPVYVLNRGNDMSRLDFCNMLTMDNHAEGMKMISTLCASGFRRVIAFCGMGDFSTAAEYSSRRRYEGMSQGVLEFKEKNCHLEKVLTVKSPDFLGVMADENLSAETVFVAMNCYLAARFADYASAAGFQAGRDYNLTAFDDHSLFRSYDLTALNVPRRKVGEILAEMITASAWYQKYPLKLSLSLCGDWVERSSCRKLVISS